MSEPAKSENQVVPLTDTAALIQVIGRAASDPNVDMDKMERLFKMHESIVARQAEQAFNVAMSEVQAKMRRVVADSENKQTHSVYASYAALDKMLRPIYTDGGFSLSFDTEDSAPDTVKVLCYVSHKAGHTRKYNVTMPADGKGAKGGDVMTKTHAMGSGMQYGQRYLLKFIFNVAIGKDDDGNGAGGAELITENQAADLIALIEEVGADKKKFMEYFKIDSIDTLPAKAYKQAVSMTEAKRRK